MEKVIINSYEEFEKLVGQQIGVSDYVELSQERINLFADATLDHQWIHVDTERAKVDSPYHSTIAHGYLTLSMLPYLWNQIIQLLQFSRYKREFFEYPFTYYSLETPKCCSLQKNPLTNKALQRHF